MRRKIKLGRRRRRGGGGEEEEVLCEQQALLNRLLKGSETQNEAQAGGCHCSSLCALFRLLSLPSSILLKKKVEV
jgi:hypothetical protein